jgi:broad specificity phosphatase PhoE
MGIALLVRHGRSTANVDGVLAGQMPGVGLAPDGIEQAAALGTAFADIPFASIHVSPLQRTRETAAAAFAGREFTLSEALLDCDYGSWTGLRTEDLKDDPLWATVHATPSTVTFPDGESIAAIAARALAYVQSQATAPGVHAFVCHADVILLIANHAVGAPLDSYQRLAVEPASVTAVWVTDDRMGLAALNVPPSGARALLMGFTKHSPASV